MTQETYENHVGIDVSKGTLDVALGRRGKVLTCLNQELALESLLSELPPVDSTLITMEATGGYERLAARVFKSRGYAVAVVNAKRVRDFAQADGQLAKTDKIDSRLIWFFSKTFNPRPQPLETNEMLLREELLARRGQMVRIIALEKQHLEHASKTIRIKIERHMKHLNKELAALDKELRELIEKDEQLKRHIEQLDEINGVGSITAMNVLIHLPELGYLSNKELSALAGLAPYNKDSGKKQGQRTIKGGRTQVRTALYMATLSAKRFNPKIKVFYDRLIAKGKRPKVAIIACMRKLLTIMNAMLRDGSRWNALC